MNVIHETLSNHKASCAYAQTQQRLRSNFIKHICSHENVIYLSCISQYQNLLRDSTSN